MSNGTKNSIRTKIHGGDFVNVKTGETLDSQFSGKIFEHKEATSVSVNYPEYTVFSDRALAWIIENLKKSDIPKVMKIATTVRYDCNILMQQNYHPYTPESIASFLGLSMNEMYVVLRRLEKQNILVCTRTYRDGYKKYVYSMNPYIAKSTKLINCEVLALFRDITKDNDSQK